MDSHDPSFRSDDRQSRRRLLGFIAAGGAALLTGLVPRSNTRAGHDSTNVLHLGEENVAPASTSIAADVEPNVLRVTNDVGSGGGAIHAHARTGMGLHGSSETFRGVYGQSVDGPGVRGDSVNEAGVDGFSENGPGVFGGSDHGPGVAGHSSAESQDAVLGNSAGANGTGVHGVGPGNGVLGESESGRGVSAFSQTGFGVEAHSTHLVGVGGFSETDLGVLGVGGVPDDSEAEGDGIGGFSFNSIGGRFVSFNGIGLRAVSPGDDHPALQAASGQPTGQHADPQADGGLALEVIGKARFSTAGSASVPQGESSVFVANEAVTAASHITVMPVDDPGNRHVRWVARDPGNGFTVHLSAAPPGQRPETPFTYLIVDPSP